MQKHKRHIVAKLKALLLNLLKKRKILIWLTSIELHHLSSCKPFQGLIMLKAQNNEILNNPTLNSSSR